MAQATADTDATTFGVPDVSIAGALMFVDGAIALLGIVTAETLYPDYSTRQDISDLGSTLPPDPVIHQPSATIFNSTMLLTGAILLVATVFAHRALRRRVLTVPLAVFGLGIFAVGLFPGNVMPWHGLAAMITFVSGGITALLSARVVRGVMTGVCLLFGAISVLALLSAIVLQAANPLLVMGSGGVERWVVYPLLLWLTGFGGYLLGVGGTVE
jgi:hypothetical membrane protein